MRNTLGQQLGTDRVRCHDHLPCLTAPGGWDRLPSMGAVTGLCRGGVSGGDMGLPNPQSDSAGDEGVGYPSRRCITRLPPCKAGLRTSPSDKTPQSEPCSDTPCISLRTVTHTMKLPDQPRKSPVPRRVMQSSATRQRVVLPTPGSYSFRVGGVKARATLQPPFKDVPFSGVFPSGSHTKGSTTQRDDGTDWHDQAGKLREAAGGQCWGQPGWGTVTTKGTWAGMELCPVDGVSQFQAATSLGSSAVGPSKGCQHCGMPQGKRGACQLWHEPAAASASST